MACSQPACRSSSCCPVALGVGMGCYRERCRPRPSHAEVRPDVSRHFCGEFPSYVMHKGLIELSCVSSFAAMVATTKSPDGARRPCTGYWALSSPTVRRAYSMPKVDTEMLNCLHDADALSNIGLRSACKYGFMCSGLVETARSATRHGLFRFRVLSPSAHAMRRRSSCTRCTMLCAA